MARALGILLTSFIESSRYWCFWYGEYLGGWPHGITFVVEGDRSEDFFRER